VHQYPRALSADSKRQQNRAELDNNDTATRMYVRTFESGAIVSLAQLRLGGIGAAFQELVQVTAWTKHFFNHMMLLRHFLVLSFPKICASRQARKTYCTMKKDDDSIVYHRERERARSGLLLLFDLGSSIIGVIAPRLSKKVVVSFSNDV
jgi:hypothetical protein